MKMPRIKFTAAKGYGIVSENSGKPFVIGTFSFSKLKNEVLLVGNEKIRAVRILAESDYQHLLKCAKKASK